MTQLYEPRQCVVLIPIVELTERNGAQSSVNATCKWYIFQCVYFRLNKYNHGQIQDRQQNRLKSEHRMAVCTQAYTTSLGRLPFNVFISVRENPSGKKTKDFPGKFPMVKMSHPFFFFFTQLWPFPQKREISTKAWLLMSRNGTVELRRECHAAQSVTQHKP